MDVSLGTTAIIETGKGDLEPLLLKAELVNVNESQAQQLLADIERANHRLPMDRKSIHGLSILGPYDMTKPDIIFEGMLFSLNIENRFKNLGVIAWIRRSIAKRYYHAGVAFLGIEASLIDYIDTMHKSCALRAKKAKQDTDVSDLSDQVLRRREVFSILKNLQHPNSLNSPVCKNDIS
jgi:hypothetical protein